MTGQHRRSGADSGNEFALGSVLLQQITQSGMKIQIGGAGHTAGQHQQVSVREVALLELQVGPLKEQSEKAKKYLVLRDDLRIKEISVWLATLDKLRSQSEAIRQEYEQLSEELTRAKAELDSVYVSGDSLTERMHRKDVESEEARERLSAAEARLSSCEAEAADTEGPGTAAQPGGGDPCGDSPRAGPDP